MQITDTEFELIQNYLKNISGISLDNTKMNMVSSRLQPLLPIYNCDDFHSLYKKATYSKEVRTSICDALTTNETSFFRDRHVYDMIKEDFIPHFLNKSSSLRILSAACSFGQEPYSLAMTLHESISNIEKYDIKIEATDISNEAIAYASYGLYTKMEIARGLDEARLYRHFDLEERGFRAKDHLRYNIHFRELNLLGEFPFQEKFDIILCRNIAIYFDLETKKRLFSNISKYLKPEGRLVLGSSESLWQITDLFQREDYKGTVYYKHNK